MVKKSGQRIPVIIIVLLVFVLGIITGIFIAVKNNDYSVQPNNTVYKTSGVSAKDIPAYDGNPSVPIQNNQPFFNDTGKSTDHFEYYGDLDKLGRCTVAYACIDNTMMPTEERESISDIKPTAWQISEYDFIDEGYLYNRCHLIGFQLTGENANEKNLITGTRYMNVQGMLPYENMVADYIRSTENHVIYRVTPIFEGKNLLASGILMEAYSIEDKGKGVCFCVYCYNVQPGISIKYSDGSNCLDSTVDIETMYPQKKYGGNTLSSEHERVTNESAGTVIPAGTTYVLNTNTMKFHKLNCESVSDMSPRNTEFTEMSRAEVIDSGYSPCGSCKP